MQAEAEAIYDQRRHHYKVEDEPEGDNKEAKFLSKMQKNAYLESDMKLEERLNRNRHYTSRNALKD